MELWGEDIHEIEFQNEKEKAWMNDSLDSIAKSDIGGKYLLFERKVFFSNEWNKQIADNFQNEKGLCDFINHTLFLLFC